MNMENEQGIKIEKGCIILAAVNIVVFLYMFVTKSAGDAEFMATHGAVYIPYMLENGIWYPVFTAIFLHFDIEHLANNMVMLVAVGRYIEKDMGTIKLVILYIISGMLGNILSIAGDFYSQEFVVSAGASGAVFGLVGGLLAMAIKNRGNIEGLGIRQILLMIALSLVSGFTSAGVDNVAHVGGLISGFVLGLVLYRAKRVQ